VGERAGVEKQSGGDLEEQCGNEDLSAGETAQQKDVDLVAADESHDKHGEYAAEGLGAHVEAIHENEWRAGNECE
jgi:hypothetical protein